MNKSFLKFGKDLSLISAEGYWTQNNASELEKVLDDMVSQAAALKSIEVNVSAISELDTFGSWLLERFKRDLVAQGAKVKIEGLSEHNNALYQQIAKVSQQGLNQADLQEHRENIVSKFWNMLTGFWYELVQFLAVFGATIAAAKTLIVQPAAFRWTSTVYQFDRVGLKALPIVILVTFIIGAIIAQQGFFHFRQFGAELYVVDMVGFLVMREIGVLLVAIVVAGRTASSYTAELGSMKMREEIDALKTMGFNPIDILVLPRVLVLIIALPALTFIGSLTALFGAGLVAKYYGDVSPELYIDRLKDMISLSHFQVGMIKAPFIGAMIGIIACTEGLLVRGSASSLGQHTTQSVVKSIFMVIFLDGMFAVFFSAIRM